MILYFSGTGNSKYIANKINDVFNEEMISMNDRIKNHDDSNIEVNGHLIFVTPTYAWRIPRIVEEYIKRVNFINVKNVYFIMTCGDEIGNANKYLMKLCKLKNFNYMGVYPIVMPENYIAMFNAPDKEEAEIIIKNAKPRIDQCISFIQYELKFPKNRNNLYDQTMSGIVNPSFYTMFVSSKKFKVKDTCIGCSLCASKCPLNNIELIHNKPVWKDTCTHCMACICYCPKEAIEYGNESIGKPRYHL